MSSMAGRHAGWYSDPDDLANYFRYWDGKAWTSRRGRAPNHPDRIKVKRIGTVLGILCVLVFLLVTYSSSTAGGVSCGTWISPNTVYSTTGNVFGSLLANDATQQCHSQLAERRMFALIALGIGFVVKFGLPYALKQADDQ